MWWRKRRKERPYQTTVRNRLQTWCLIAQQKWADYLQAKAQSWSVKQKKWYCALFCLVAGGASAAILITTFFSPMRAGQIAKSTDQIQRPTLPARPPQSRWNASDTLVVQQFRRWVDSMALTAAGRRGLDSLYRQHPGLIDSLLDLESIILHSSKEKTP